MNDFWIQAGVIVATALVGYVCGYRDSTTRSAQVGNREIEIRVTTKLLRGEVSDHEKEVLAAAMAGVTKMWSTWVVERRRSSSKTE